MSQKKHNLYKLPYSARNLSKRDFLVTYCYSSTSESIRVFLKDFFKNCTDDKIISFCYDFMVYAIMPYYKVNRTLFNRVRGNFMDALYYAITNSADDTLYDNLKEIHKVYGDWCHYGGIQNDEECLIIYKNIMNMPITESQINSEKTLEGII